MAGVRGQNSKPIRQLDYYDGEFIDVYPSIEDAAFDNYTTRKTIERALSMNNGYVHTFKLRFERV